MIVGNSCTSKDLIGVEDIELSTDYTWLFYFFGIRETAHFLFIILNAPVHKFSSLLTSYTVTIDRIHTVNGG